MISRKYVGDYRLENVEKNGKLVTKPVYKGSYYVYVEPEAEAKRARTLVTVLTALAVASFIASLASYSNKGLTSQYYTLMPFAVCVFPLMYLCFAIYGFYKYGMRMTREQKEKTSDRLPKCTLVMLILSGWNLCGIGLALILKAVGRETRVFGVTDALYLGLSTLFFVIVTVIFTRRKRLAMRTE